MARIYILRPGGRSRGAGLFTHAALMATGYTQAELDALLMVLEDTVPRTPSKKDKMDAEPVTAMRFAGTEKGVLVNFETGNGKQEIYWLNCWAAKELAAALSAAASAFGWRKRVLAATLDERLAEPRPLHLAAAISVNSLSTSADRSGVMVRFAIEHRVRHTTLYLPAAKAQQLMLAIIQGAEAADWWDDRYELIPGRRGQH